MTLDSAVVRPGPQFLLRQGPRSDATLPLVDVIRRSFRRNQRDAFRHLLVSQLTATERSAVAERSRDISYQL